MNKERRRSINNIKANIARLKKELQIYHQNYLLY